MHGNRVIWGFLVLAMVLYPATPVFALFGVKTSFKSMKDSVDKQFSDIKAGINDVKLSVGQVSASLSNQIKAYDKSATAGRDITTTTTNDTGLMKYIFKILSGIFMAMIAFMKAELRDARKQIRYLEESRLKYQNMWIELLSPEWGKIKKEYEKKE